MSGAVSYRTKLTVTLPGNHFAALGGGGGGGGGGVSSGHKCKIQLNAPTSFSPNYDAKRGGV